jgi:CRP-like cAMP-binding protein
MNIKPENLKDLFRSAQTKEFNLSTQIIEEGTDSGGIYLIISGLVKIYNFDEEGKEAILSLRGEGEIIGLYSLLTNSKHQANVQAVQKTVLLRLDKEEFRQRLEFAPQLNFKLLSYLTLQIRQENKYLKRVLTENLESRVLKTLKRLSKSFSEGISLSHEDLAKIIGATRPRVTESLHKLENQNKLFFKERRIFLKV